MTDADLSETAAFLEHRCLLPDDDTAVERLAAEMREHHKGIGFEHGTSTCGPGCAKAIIAALREGGPRADGPRAVVESNRRRSRP